MDFSLTEQQEEFRSYVRKVLTQESITQIARHFASGDETALTKAHDKLTELGVMGISILENYGGIELGVIDLIPVMEELGRAVMPDIYAETLAFAVPVLVEHGTEQQKENYLSSIAEGASLLALAWLEPKGKYSFDTVNTTVSKAADGFVLNGTKSLVRHTAQVTDFIVLAKDDQDELRMFIVPKEQVTKMEEQQSFDETQRFVQLTFDHVVLTTEQQLAADANVEKVIEKGLLSLLVAINSMMIGSMDRLVDMATEYAKIREQFGQPIGRFQAIKHRLADLKVMLETARALSHYATWTVENGSEDCIEVVYSAKALLTDSYIKIAAESVQIHGGIGFTEELDCHLYVKRSRIFENYLGSQYDTRERAALALGW
ncbi:acyl-CoA dehydrogenase family protein [Lysinibacillus sp. LZ02]|uniref:acyl-CoA dehydrogenase family protein n=1 Tax=Lysinibacillus sp. LZ02 TaxID=3420668 RepID=UPI003D36E338